MAFSLAHLSDLHLPLSMSPALHRLTAKQLLAYLSWQRKRRHVSSPIVLAALRADVAAHAPDHIAVIGDLVNLALPAEFAEAASWLGQVGSGEHITVIPGNHELTRRLPWRDGLGQWAGWMRGERGADAPGAFRRRLDGVALVGLSSATPTVLFSARGGLGRGQIAQAEAWLAESGAAGLCRIVLIHHPPVMGPGGPRKALRDRVDLCAALRRSGAELVLHGHHHADRLTTLPGPLGSIAVVGVASGSAGVKRPQLASWRLHKVARDGADWLLTTVTRRYDPAAEQFTGAGEWTVRAAVWGEPGQATRLDAEQGSAETCCCLKTPHRRGIA